MIQSHQPVIKGAPNQHHQRRPSTSAPGHPPHKRNLADKLMTFLRLRPKYYVPSSASDMTLCSSSSAAGREKRNLNKKYSQQYPDFNAIDHDGGEENGNGSIDSAARPRQPRRGSALGLALKATTPTAAVPEPQYDAKQRRSVDLSTIPSLHAQYLADSAPQKYADDWPHGNTVTEEATDASMVTITPLPTSPPPMTPGASTLLKQSSKFNFPPLPP